MSSSSKPRVCLRGLLSPTVMMRNDQNEGKNLMRSRLMVVATWMFVRLRVKISQHLGVQLDFLKTDIHFNLW